MRQKNLSVYKNESQTCGTDDCFVLPNMRAPLPWIHIYICIHTNKQTNKHTYILTYIHECMSQKVSEHIHEWFTNFINDSRTCCTEIFLQRFFFLQRKKSLYIWLPNIRAPRPYIHTYMYSYIHTYIHIHTHTCIYRYLTHIHAYIHAYIHTYIQAKIDR